MSNITGINSFCELSSMYVLYNLYTPQGFGWLTDCNLQKSKFQIFHLFAYLIYISPLLLFTEVIWGLKKALPILLICLLQKYTCLFKLYTCFLNITCACFDSTPGLIPQCIGLLHQYKNLLWYRKYLLRRYKCILNSEIKVYRKSSCKFQVFVHVKMPIISKDNLQKYLSDVLNIDQ
jgi:hypothetical protein